jgi:hypothetical protein
VIEYESGEAHSCRIATSQTPAWAGWWQVLPAEEPQASVYVDQIAPRFGNPFLHIDDLAGQLGSLGLQGVDVCSCRKRWR